MTHRYAPRTHSQCCRARVADQHCSECHKAAPWRTRLTADQAVTITARLNWPAVVVSAEQLARAKAALYEENYD